MAGMHWLKAKRIRKGDQSVRRFGGEWVCGQCNALNNADDEKCPKCGSDRGGFAGGPSGASNDGDSSLQGSSSLPKGSTVDSMLEISEGALKEAKLRENEAVKELAALQKTADEQRRARLRAAAEAREKAAAETAQRERQKVEGKQAAEAKILAMLDADEKANVTATPSSAAPTTATVDATGAAQNVAVSSLEGLSPAERRKRLLDERKRELEEEEREKRRKMRERRQQRSAPGAGAASAGTAAPAECGAAAACVVLDD
eukprot:TRINITY_DN5119_c3_g1_i1.p1 TRINITY_DN5119_c3_g1~~TRINITY_DN5119_c3_g1_i1.p1  ORF type:complete len:259 (-),score=88.84 TRINITY_DN5119_c3_g1_i1:192-968(-)